MAAEYVLRIGKRIRQRREQLKAERGDDYTQDGVARQMPGKTTGTAVSRWERGEHAPLDSNMEELARVLEVPVAYFYTAPIEGEEPASGSATPDAMAALDGNVDNSGTDDRLRHIEATLVRLEGKLDELLDAVSGEEPEEPGERGQATG